MWQPNGPRLNFLYRLLMLLFFFKGCYVIGLPLAKQSFVLHGVGMENICLENNIREKNTSRHKWQLDLALHFQKLLLSKVFYKTEKEISWWDVFIFRGHKIKYARGSNISLNLLDIKRGMRIFKHLYFIAPMHFWVCICLFSLPTSEPKILN